MPARRRLGIGAFAVLVAVVVLPVGACGKSSSATSPADENYLSELHGAAPDVGSFRSDIQLVRLGHAACDGLAAGASYETVADRLALQEQHPALPSADLGAVITSAADNICPQYHDRVS